MKLYEDFKDEFKMIDDKFWDKIEEEKAFHEKSKLIQQYWVYDKIYGKHKFK